LERHIAVKKLKCTSSGMAAVRMARVSFIEGSVEMLYLSGQDDDEKSG